MSPFTGLCSLTDFCFFGASIEHIIYIFFVAFVSCKIVSKYQTMKPWTYLVLYHVPLCIQELQCFKNQNLHFYWMIQDKPIFCNTIFVTKGVMKFSIVLLYNKQPIIFPQLMQIITTASGTSLIPIVSSYQILILNIENSFKNDFKCSSGRLMLYAVCNIIP